MTEEECRAMGIQQSPGWIHYMCHKPGKTPQKQALYLIKFPVFETHFMNCV